MLLRSSLATSVLPLHSMQVGDIIKSVNGVSVEGLSHPEVIQLLKESAENIAIDVMRGNEPVSAKTTSAMVLELGVVVERKDSGAIQVLECFVGGAADKIGKPHMTHRHRQQLTRLLARSHLRKQ